MQDPAGEDRPSIEQPPPDVLFQGLAAFEHHRNHAQHRTGYQRVQGPGQFDLAKDVMANNDLRRYHEQADGNQYNTRPEEYGGKDLGRQ